jgi:hypothetical protein
MAGTQVTGRRWSTLWLLEQDHVCQGWRMANEFLDQFLGLIGRAIVNDNDLVG